jgi:hypothetical protein
MAAATLSVGVLLAILEAAPEIRVPFRVDSHQSSKLGGKSQGGRRDRNQPYRESPQRECITLDRTLWATLLRYLQFSCSLINGLDCVERRRPKLLNVNPAAVHELQHARIVDVVPVAHVRDAHRQRH